MLTWWTSLVGARRDLVDRTFFGECLDDHVAFNAHQDRQARGEIRIDVVAVECRLIAKTDVRLPQMYVERYRVRLFQSHRNCATLPVSAHSRAQH